MKLDSESSRANAGRNGCPGWRTDCFGLIYVSPDQINAQLPGDLEPGDYRLTVRTEGMPDVKSDFTVVRNAPGLFVNMVGHDILRGRLA